MNAVRGSMVIEKMLDDEFRAHHVQPTDAQIKQYYDEHRDLFVKDPGEVQIAHIAVKIPPKATDAEKKAAEAKIIKLYKEAQTKKDYATIAQKNSEDAQYAAKGGDIGYFELGQDGVGDSGRAYDADGGVESGVQLYQGDGAARRIDRAANRGAGEGRDIHPRRESGCGGQGDPQEARERGKDRVQESAQRGGDRRNSADYVIRRPPSSASVAPVSKSVSQKNITARATS
jgi:hypothetical protein